MDDLIYRLREDQPGERQGKREARCELHSLLQEAALEIEHLRKTADVKNFCQEQMEGLQGENDRLHALLDELFPLADEAAEELFALIRNEYQDRKTNSLSERRYKRDIELPSRIRALLDSNQRPEA